MRKLFISLVYLMVISSCTHSNIKKEMNNKPDTNEYWTTLSDYIALDSEDGLHNYLQIYNPGLWAQIEKDSHDPYLLMFWGRSSNIDASNDKIIVDEKILNQLFKKFNFYPNGKMAHAGIIHSYGYLFSNLITPYGFKRKRWIDHSLSQAFSFQGECLSPQTNQGSLLSNLTYFAGMITFKNKTSLQLLRNVSPEIMRFDYDQLKVAVLEEKTAHFIIKTSFVTYPKKIEQDENKYLLIYTIENLKLGTESLITAFPVNEKTFLNSQKAEFLGKNKEITLRYNAVVENFPSNAFGLRVFLNH